MPRKKKPQIEPVIGKKINKLTILGFGNKNGKKSVICKCDCGKDCELNFFSVKYQLTTSCGCNYRLNLVGQKFGKLLVLSHFSENKMTMANCICDCGNTRVCHASDLTRKRISCCGCSNGDVKRKRKYLNRQLYEVWKGMKARCRDKNHISYKNYGGRGVRVCEEWDKDFLPFYNWCMENGWEPGKEIDKLVPSPAFTRTQTLLALSLIRLRRALKVVAGFNQTRRRPIHRRHRDRRRIFQYRRRQRLGRKFL